MLERIIYPFSDLPHAPGTYVLLLFLPRQQTIAVGRLGIFDFPDGYYLYVGSAFGPGGLAARVKRHGELVKQSYKKLRWHIDYLREQASLIESWYEIETLEREHHWAKAACQMSKATIPAPRFGASDCWCPSHLIHFATQPKLRNLQSLA